MRADKLVPITVAADPSIAASPETDSGEKVCAGNCKNAGVIDLSYNSKTVLKKEILVIDVGGSNVKLMISRGERRKFKSRWKLTPRSMVNQIKALIADWEFDVISSSALNPKKENFFGFSRRRSVRNSRH